MVFLVQELEEGTNDSSFVHSGQGEKCGPRH